MVAVLSPLGASTARKAAVEAFIETSFKLDDGTIVRPDGLIQATYGSFPWKALVEVKTGNNLLPRSSSARVHRVAAHTVRAKVHRGVSDPEQAWMLGELIRYLQHPASGAMHLDDMGANRPGTRDAAREGTLRRTDDACREIAQRWDQVMRFAALRLGSHIGVDVQPVVPRAHADPTVRLSHLTESVATRGVLDGTLRRPTV